MEVCRYYQLTETGFYYLQSRYYDPVVKRFLNADSYGSTGQGFLGYNMFAYCENNPVVSSDDTGDSPYGKLTLFDYWLIHKLVQYSVAIPRGWRTEVYIKTADGKKGYLDIYDSKNNAFYEVKSTGAAAHLNILEKQLIKYLNAAFIKDVTGNSFPKKGTDSYIGACFKYGNHTVAYMYTAPGLIQYAVDDPNAFQNEYQFEVVKTPQRDKQLVQSLSPHVIVIPVIPGFGGAGGGGGAPWNTLHPVMS